MAAPLAIASTVGGSLLSAFGAGQSARAQSQMYNYQAGVAELNKKIALQNRDYALQVGDKEGERYGMQAAQRMGTIRARQGASGIDVGSGSPVSVRESQQKVTDIDLAQIRDNAARKAYGYTVEAQQDETQAGLYRTAAADASKAGTIKAIGSLISGAGSVADKWYQGQSVGIFGPSTTESTGDPWAGLR